MSRVVGVMQIVLRISGLAQLAMGLALWSGMMAVLPFHLLNGFAYVLLLEVLAVLAAFAGASWRLVLLAVAWGLFLPVFGMTQSDILPGEPHWIIQVAHLAVGLVAMGLAERVGMVARSKLQGARRDLPSSQPAG